MNPFALVRQTLAEPNPKDGTILLYVCGVCGLTHSPQIYGGDDALMRQRALESAERCCKPVMCERCGEPAMKHRTACEACLHKEAVEREQKRIDAAEKLSIGECTGPVLYNDDEYFSSIEDLLDHLHHDVDLDDDDFPIVAWCCDETTPQMDADRVLEDFEENLELGDELAIEDVVNDLDGLRTAIKTWNAKQEAKLWLPTEKRCVLINKTDISSNEG